MPGRFGVAGPWLRPSAATKAQAVKKMETVNVLRMIGAIITQP